MLQKVRTSLMLLLAVASAESWLSISIHGAPNAARAADR
jgi:hypothetical protein